MSVPHVNPALVQKGPDTVSDPQTRQPADATSRPPAALAALLDYHRAWSGGDFDAAMGFVADDVVVLTPAGQLNGADAFRAFMGPFSATVIRYRQVAAFGDDATAVIVYDTDTVPVPDAPGAECVRVTDGRITWMRIIFDRVPFEAARAAATT